MKKDFQTRNEKKKKERNDDDCFFFKSRVIRKANPFFSSPQSQSRNTLKASTIYRKTLRAITSFNLISIRRMFTDLKGTFGLVGFVLNPTPLQEHYIYVSDVGTN